MLSRCGIDQNVQADPVHPGTAMATGNGSDKARVQATLPAGIRQFGQEGVFVTLGLHAVEVEHAARLERIKSTGQ